MERTSGLAQNGSAQNGLAQSEVILRKRALESGSISHQARGFVVAAAVATLATFALSACSSTSVANPEGSAIQTASQNAAATESSATTSEQVAADSTASISGANSGATEAQPSTRILRSASKGSLGIELLDGAGYNKVVVRSADATQPLKYEVSRLANPSRLVVDVLGVPSRAAQSFNTADAELVSKIRVGVHPEKSRIVFDLIPSEKVEHHIDGVTETGTSGKALVITIARPGKLEVARAASWETSSQDAAASAATTASTSFTSPSRAASQSASASNTTNAASADHAAITDESDVRASFGDSESADAAKTETASAESAGDDVAANGSTVVAANNSTNNSTAAGEVSRPRITALSIDPIGPTENMIVAELSAASTYSLKRTAPSEYVLSIKNTEVDPDASATLVAPPGAGQIRTVRPVAAGDNVMLRIFADPKSTLTARSNANKIVVVASSAESSDMRAQMDPDAKAAADKAAPAKAEAAAKADDKKEEKGDSKEVQLGAENSASQAGADIDAGVQALLGEQPKYTGRLISLDLQDTDIDNALRIIAEVSNLNIIASDDVTGKVTLRLIDVPWDQALDVILKTNGLDKVQEGNVVRIAPVEKLRLEREALKQAQQAEEELEPLQVRYIRISYAKAAELRPLVEAVISERGSVSYDERTNQLIVKDIRKGIKNVVELVSKLDLRTPQILLETQIVEANRNLLRSLGTELGFNLIQSPATGNATGANFPNSVLIGGTSKFPAAVDATLGGSAISFVLDSADGTKSLNATLNALEQEGRVRIVSRPAVATTNNTAAQIKSVEKIRVKTPSGGTVVGVGQGSAPNSGGSSATESIEIGIVLDVTPQASPDYFVLLDVKAKSSTFGSREVEGIPSEIERSATSTVLVSSGQTFAMGGIYRIIDRDTVTGVPFLKDIPVLGHLFRTMKSDNSDEELIFFVTPRIIEGSFDDAAMKVSL